MKKVGNCGPSGCPKSGIKIHSSENDYVKSPFSSNVTQNTSSSTQSQNAKANSLNDPELINKFDLNIENYNLEGIYKLFHIQTTNLNEDIMKEAKKFVLKTHPDKSRLDPRFFLFYSKAYKRLYSVYEFQNKSTNKKPDRKEYENDEHARVLDAMFEKQKNLKDAGSFNKWFNDQFEKHRVDDPIESGYADWLKSDDGIVNMDNVTKANMASELDKHKKRVQALTPYTGVTDMYAPVFAGTTLMDNNSNYSSGTLFSNNGIAYTDIKQAYNESVIPITEDEYDNMPKFRNVNEYKTHRDNVDVTPPDEKKSMRILVDNQSRMDQESAAMAYQMARQMEKAKEQNNSFWASLKQITY
jgi:hypothetical protein